MSELAPREEASAEGASIAPRVERPLVFREALPVPEPWSRTRWEVTKPLPPSIGLMYGVQWLPWPEDISHWTWCFWMGGPLALGLFFLFWAGLGGVMWYSSRIMRKAAKESELECPACTRPLVNLLGSARLNAQLEDLGRCPQSAARITLEVL